MEFDDDLELDIPPETLALREDPAEFKEALEEFLCAHQSDLNRILTGYCSDGAWVESGSIYVDPDGLTLAGQDHGSFGVSFTEEKASGCRDMFWTGKMSATLKFTLDFEAGTMTIESLPEFERSPDE